MNYCQNERSVFKVMVGFRVKVRLRVGVRVKVRVRVGGWVKIGVRVSVTVKVNPYTHPHTYRLTRPFRPKKPATRFGRV